MKRWILNIFCGLSLLVLATSVMLRVRSYFVAEGLWNITEHTQDGVGSSTTRVSDYGVAWEWGKLEVSWKRTNMPGSRSAAKGWQHLFSKATGNIALPLRTNHDRINFCLGGSQLVYLVHTAYGGWSEDYFRVLLPLWIFLIFAVPPLVWWRQQKAKGGKGFPVDAVETPAGLHDK